MYLLALFVYSMRNQKPHVNTVFRMIYIYKVSTAYLNGTALPESDETVILDEHHKGVGDYRLLTSALAAAVSQGYIYQQDNTLVPGEDLESFISEYSGDNGRSSNLFREDIQRISYFADVVFSYGEDVILTVLYEEPNYKETTARNRKEIDLSDNKLYSLLAKFEQIAGNQSRLDNEQFKLEKYDVFIRWLDFVFDEYLREKSIV